MERDNERMREREREKKKEKKRKRKREREKERDPEVERDLRRREREKERKRRVRERGEIRKEGWIREKVETGPREKERKEREKESLLTCGFGCDSDLLDQCEWHRATEERGNDTGLLTSCGHVLSLRKNSSGASLPFVGDDVLEHVFLVSLLVAEVKMYCLHVPQGSHSRDVGRLWRSKPTTELEHHRHIFRTRAHASDSKHWPARPEETSAMSGLPHPQRFLASKKKVTSPPTSQVASPLHEGPHPGRGLTSHTGKKRL